MTERKLFKEVFAAKLVAKNSKSNQLSEKENRKKKSFVFFNYTSLWVMVDWNIFAGMMGTKTLWESHFLGRRTNSHSVRKTRTRRTWSPKIQCTTQTSFCRLSPCKLWTLLPFKKIDSSRDERVSLEALPALVLVLHSFTIFCAGFLFDTAR